MQNVLTEIPETDIATFRGEGRQQKVRGKKHPKTKATADETCERRFANVLMVMKSHRGVCVCVCVCVWVSKFHRRTCNFSS